MKKRVKRMLAAMLAGCVLCGCIGVPAYGAETTDAEQCDIILQNVYNKLVIPHSDDPLITTLTQQLDSKVAGYLAIHVADAGRTTVFQGDAVGTSYDGSNVIGNGVLAKLKEIARAYKSPDSRYYHQPEILEMLKTDLAWVYDNYYNPSKHDEYYPNYKSTTGMKGNWWAWEIGIPANLTDICVILKDDLTEAEIEKYAVVCDVFTPSPFWAMGGVSGANGIWINNVVIKIAALRGNPPYTGKPADYPKNNWSDDTGLRGYTNKLDAARDKASQLIELVTSGDGFYADGSYIGHTTHAYSGGYGLSFYNDTLAHIDMLSGSVYAPKAEKLEVLRKWTFEAMEPMIYDINFLVSTIGREIGRIPSEIGRTKSTLTGFLYYQKIAQGADKERAAALIKYIAQRLIEEKGRTYVYSGFSPDQMLQLDSILNDETIAPRTDLSKAHVFSMMGRVVNYKQDWGSALSYFDTRLSSHEDGGEFRTGWNWNSGMLYIYNDDFDTFSGKYWPTVDPSRYPGTTVAYGSTDASNKNNSFGGGTSLGDRFTAVTFDLKPTVTVSGTNPNLNAHKSYFTFDNEIVCIGTGITATATDAHVNTTVENRLIQNDLSNPFMVNGTAQPTGETVVDNAVWAHYTGNTAGADIGYYFPEATQLHVKKESRTGEWSSVGKSSGQETAGYATAWIDHGAKPSGGSYQYVILPGKTAAQTEAYAQNPAVEVVRATQNTHIVYNQESNAYAASFYAAGEDQTAPIWAGAPASVLTLTEGDITEISVADPTMAAGTVSFKIAIPCGSVVEANDAIDIRSMGSSLIFTANFKNTKGQPLTFKISSEAGDYTGQKELITFEDGDFYGDVLGSGASVAVVDECATNKVLQITQTMNAPKEETETFDAGADSEGWETVNAKNPITYDNTVNHSGTNSYSARVTGNAAMLKNYDPQNAVFEIYMYDADPTADADGFVQAADVMVGVIKTVNTTATTYMAGTYNNWVDTGIPRTKGWHKIVIDATDPTGVTYYLDDQQIGTAPATTVAEVRIGDYWNVGTAGSLYFDDLRIYVPGELAASNATVRQYNPFITAGLSAGMNVRSDYTGSEEITLMQMENGSGEAAAAFTLKDGTLWAHTGDGAQQVKALAPNEWVNLAAFVSGEENTASLYADGVLCAQGSLMHQTTLIGGVSHRLGNVDAVLQVDNVLFVPGEEDYFAGTISETYDFTSETEIDRTLQMQGSADGVLTLAPSANVFSYDFENGSLAGFIQQAEQSGRPMPTVTSATAYQGNRSLEMLAISEMLQDTELGNYKLEAYMKSGQAGGDASGIIGIQRYEGTVKKAEIVLGIKHDFDRNNYVYRVGGPGNQWVSTGVPISGDWDLLTIDATDSAKVLLQINGQTVATVTPDKMGGTTAFNRVDIGNLWMVNAKPVYLDNLVLAEPATPGDVSTAIFKNKAFPASAGTAYVEAELLVGESDEPAALVLYGEGMQPLLQIGYAGEALVAQAESGEVVLTESTAGSWHTVTVKLDMQQKEAAVYVDGALQAEPLGLLSPNAKLFVTAGSAAGTQVQLDHLTIANEMPPAVYGIRSGAGKRISALGGEETIRVVLPGRAGAQVYVAFYQGGALSGMKRFAMPESGDFDSGILPVSGDFVSVFTWTENTLQPADAVISMGK